MVSYKKDQLPYLSDNLCCKIASENETLVLLVVCGIERHALNLNHFSSLISKYFCKTDANSVPQRRTR